MQDREDMNELKDNQKLLDEMLNMLWDRKRLEVLPPLYNISTNKIKAHKIVPGKVIRFKKLGRALKTRDKVIKNRF